MNARSAQALAAVLGFLLIVLIGASIFLLLTQHSPRSTLAPVTAPPSPSNLTPSLGTSPGTSPSTLEPTPSGPGTTLVSTPTPSSTPTEPATPTPSPTPSPTPVPTVNPTSPRRDIRVSALGLDNHDPEVGIARLVTFNVDGPSLITAKLSNVSAGQVRACLWQGDDVLAKTCRTTHGGKLQVATFGAGQTTWHLSLIGNHQQVSPYVDLDLGFNTDQPSVRFDNLRFQGIPIPNYNGLTATVEALADGQLQLNGAFDSGHQHAYRIVIEQLGPDAATLYDQTGGPNSGFNVSQSATNGVAYRLTVSNPNEQAEVTAVFLSLTISWP